MTVPCAHVHLGLVIQHEFALGQGAADSLQAFVMAADAAVLLGVEDVVTVLARQLGLIHGLVGLAQQLIRIDVFRLRIEGDAETGRDLEYEVANLHRLGSGGEQAGEHRRTGFDVGQIEQHGDELVAAQAGEGVAFAQSLLHAGGHGDQQLVAGFMSMVVVDGLEAIQVEKGHRQPLSVAVAPEPWPGAGGRPAARGWADWSARRSGRCVRAAVRAP